MHWVEFKQGEELPLLRRYVLVQLDEDTAFGMPPSVAVGYLKYQSDDVTPYFVVPGFGRRFAVTHWCDSLGDDFHAPMWQGEQTVAK